MLGGPTSDELFNLGLQALTDNNDSGRSKAIKYFTKAQTHEKPHPVASYMLGQIYEAREPTTITEAEAIEPITNTEAAFLAYKKAIETNNTFVAAWLALERYFRLGIGTPKNEELASLCRENILLIEKNVLFDGVDTTLSSEMKELTPLPITHCYSSYNEKIKKLEEEIKALKEAIASTQQEKSDKDKDNNLGKLNGSNKDRNLAL